MLMLFLFLFLVLILILCQICGRQIQIWLLDRGSCWQPSIPFGTCSILPDPNYILAKLPPPPLPGRRGSGGGRAGAAALTSGGIAALELEQVVGRRSLELRHAVRAVEPVLQGHRLQRDRGFTGHVGDPAGPPIRAPLHACQILRAW